MCKHSIQTVTVPYIVCRSQSPQVTKADRTSESKRPSSSIHLSNSCITHMHKFSAIYWSMNRNSQYRSLVTSVSNTSNQLINLTSAIPLTDTINIIITYLKSPLQVWLVINLILNYASQLPKHEQQNQLNTQTYHMAESEKSKSSNYHIKRVIIFVVIFDI